MTEKFPKWLKTLWEKGETACYKQFNDRKVSKRVENTGKKEKLLVTSNFSLFPQCFQKNSTTGM